MALVVDEYVQGLPAAAMRDVVAQYSGYRQRGMAPAVFAGLPSPYLTLIFAMDEPLAVVRHVDPRRMPGRYDGLLGGLHTSPAYVGHDGAQSGVQVELSPLGTRQLLGVPAGELAGLEVDPDVLLPGVVEEVREALGNTVDWRARFAAVDEALRRRLQPDHATVSAEVRFAWSRLLMSGGRIGVAALARETGWSERHLGVRMRQETGLSPKRAARVIRFDRARRLLQRRCGTGLAGVAADCGYADQAHMSRDFVEMAGRPPSRWFAEQVGNLQSSTGSDG